MPIVIITNVLLIYFLISYLMEQHEQAKLKALRQESVNLLLLLAMLERQGGEELAALMEENMARRLEAVEQALLQQPAAPPMKEEQDELQPCAHYPLLLPAEVEGNRIQASAILFERASTLLRQ
jgi:hypothetical protein